METDLHSYLLFFSNDIASICTCEHNVCVRHNISAFGLVVSSKNKEKCNKFFQEIMSYNSDFNKYKWDKYTWDSANQESISKYYKLVEVTQNFNIEIIKLSNENAHLYDYVGFNTELKNKIKSLQVSTLRSPFGKTDGIKNINNQKYGLKNYTCRHISYNLDDSIAENVYFDLLKLVYNKTKKKIGLSKFITNVICEYIGNRKSVMKQLLNSLDYFLELQDYGFTL